MVAEVSGDGKGKGGRAQGRQTGTHTELPAPTQFRALSGLGFRVGNCSVIQLPFTHLVRKKLSQGRIKTGDRTRQIILNLGRTCRCCSEHRGVSGKLVCGRYSSFELAPGETAEIEGAGATSVSMRITGPKGVWIFYEGLTQGEPESALGSLVYQGKAAKIYRRGHDARVYVVIPTFKHEVDGKTVQASASGIDFRREPLPRAAITGTNADLSVVKRIYPASQKQCDIRWMPGGGLVVEK
jgi:hypothetical protein